MIARQEVVDGDRSDAAIGAVDDDLGAGRLRLDAQAAGLRRVRKLEVLRDLGAGGDVDVMTRGTPRPRSSRMCGPTGTENRAGVWP